MYELIKSVIESRNYELSDIKKKIDIMWLQGDITEEQRTELAQLAESNAKPENTYAPLQEQIDKIANDLSNLLSQVETNTLAIQAIKNKLEEEGTIIPKPEPEPSEEFKPFVQPSGAHDAYHNGDKVTFNGKKYICIADKGIAVVWSPDVMPSYWSVVEDE